MAAREEAKLVELTDQKNISEVDGNADPEIDSGAESDVDTRIDTARDEAIRRVNSYSDTFDLEAEELDARLLKSHIPFSRTHSAFTLRFIIIVGLPMIIFAFSVATYWPFNRRGEFIMIFWAPALIFFCLNVIAALCIKCGCFRTSEPDPHHKFPFFTHRGTIGRLWGIDHNEWLSDYVIFCTIASYTILTVLNVVTSNLLSHYHHIEDGIDVDFHVYATMIYELHTFPTFVTVFVALVITIMAGWTFPDKNGKLTHQSHRGYWSLCERSCSCCGDSRSPSGSANPNSFSTNTDRKDLAVTIRRDQKPFLKYGIVVIATVAMFGFFGVLSLLIVEEKTVVVNSEEHTISNGSSSGMAVYLNGNSGNLLEVSVNDDRWSISEGNSTDSRGIQGMMLSHKTEFGEWEFEYGSLVAHLHDRTYGTTFGETYFKVGSGFDSQEVDFSSLGWEEGFGLLAFVIWDDTPENNSDQLTVKLKYQICDPMVLNTFQVMVILAILIIMVNGFMMQRFFLEVSVILNKNFRYMKYFSELPLTTIDDLTMWWAERKQFLNLNEQSILRRNYRKASHGFGIALSAALTIMTFLIIGYFLWDEFLAQFSSYIYLFFCVFFIAHVFNMMSECMSTWHQQNYHRKRLNELGVQMKCEIMKLVPSYNEEWTPEEDEKELAKDVYRRAQIIHTIDYILPLLKEYDTSPRVFGIEIKPTFFRIFIGYVTIGLGAILGELVIGYFTED